jgi:hypothetical protein
MCGWRRAEVQAGATGEVPTARQRAQSVHTAREQSSVAEMCLASWHRAKTYTFHSMCNQRMATHTAFAGAEQFLEAFGLDGVTPGGGGT